MTVWGDGEEMMRDGGERREKRGEEGGEKGRGKEARGEWIAALLCSLVS